MRCWCGGTQLVLFGEGYLECPACGGLLRAEMPGEDLTRIADESRDFYGREYWFSRQAERGQGDLEARSVADLPERCLYWLRTVLAYRRPPGRALELGAAHGAMTALLGAAGFDAVGLELSPWVADWARSNFGVTMLAGPLEDQEFEPGSFDLIVAMDVLEHLADPLGILEQAARLLHPKGVLVLQTPCRPTGRSLEELRSEGHRFTEMLLEEHLFLFTESSVREALRRADLREVAFEPALFAHYDMFLLAGRKPLERSDERSVRAALLTPTSRIVLAMMDLDEEKKRLESAYREADADRQARQTQVEDLELAYREADADRRARQAQVEDLERAYREADADRRARQAQVEDLESAYREADADRQARQAQVEDLESAYREADADRRARQEQIDELHLLLDREKIRSATAEAGIEELREENERRHAILESRFSVLEAKHRRILTESSLLRRQKKELRDELVPLRSYLSHLEERHAYLRSLAFDHRGSRIYRALVRLGRWRPHDLRLCAALEEICPPQRDRAISVGWQAVAHEVDAQEATAPTRTRGGPIAIDLTALLPGGENGGAKLVALELVRAMGRLAPDRAFLLLTTEPCHEELAALESANVHRLKIAPGPAHLGEILESEPFALFFCPTTAPAWRDPRVPLVCLVHDLQYLSYPEFFTATDRAERDSAFRRAVREAERIVTVSDYVRETVRHHSDRATDEVVAIKNALDHRLRAPEPQEVEEALARFGLEQGLYFLYPANFWAHKNHRLLLTAFAQLRHRSLKDVRLVLTGAERPDPAPLREVIRKMELGDAVRVAGYVSDAELASLLAGARALVFPSLYEGFGIPVLEAMARGCPVACSNVTSLPEVAGEAAIFFDPRKPAEIAGVLERLLHDDELCASLAARGLERAREIGGVERMARVYLDVFEAARAAPRRFNDALVGVFPDGWTRGRLVVSYASVAHELEIGMTNARSEEVVVAVKTNGEQYRATLAPGASLLERCPLRGEPGYVVIDVRPTFCPALKTGTSDTRSLGVKLWACRLDGPGFEADLLDGGG